MIKFTDRANIGDVKTTPEGYILARSRALRVGVQDYLASELGLFGNHIVKVYRPPESVFDADSMASMVHKPVTVDHPAELVTPENYADLAVGEVSTRVKQDDGWLALEILVKDKRGIDAINGGKMQWSAGYTADMQPAPDGSPYDFIMGPPSYNHLALVDNARAGKDARIGDGAVKPWGAAPLNLTGNKEHTEMDFVKVKIGDQTVNIAVADADHVIKLTTVIDAQKEEIAALKIECADNAKLIVSDADIAKRVADGVKELGEVVAKATALVEDYDATGKDAMTIKREVIKAVYGDEAAADLEEDAEVNAAFKVAKSKKKKETDPVMDGIAKQGTKVTDAWGGLYKAKGAK